jgi:hypothetical protein
MEVFMAKRAKASEPSEPEREAGIVQMDEPVPDPPVTNARPQLPPPSPPPPPVTTTAPSGPSFWDRVGGFFRFLFRLVLLLLILTVVSMALYFALPLFYDTFVRPVEQNTTQVRELQSRQEQTEQQLSDLQTKLDTLESVQNEHDGTLTELDQRVIDIETEIAARTESLAALERLQAELEAQNQEVSDELERQIDLLKSMELLSRARLSMYQSNFGLARQDVQIARDLLDSIQPDAPSPLREELGAAVQRLDMTLSNLPAFPVVASDDLDIAWQILFAGLPEETPTITATPMSVGPAGSATPTPSAADMTITPTLQATATVRASATP